jgi:hypothetical protein
MWRAGVTCQAAPGHRKMPEKIQKERVILKMVRLLHASPLAGLVPYRDCGNSLEFKFLLVHGFLLRSLIRRPDAVGGFAGAGKEETGYSVEFYRTLSPSTLRYFRGEKKKQGPWPSGDQTPQYVFVFAGFGEQSVGLPNACERSLLKNVVTAYYNGAWRRSICTISD